MYVVVICDKILITNFEYFLHEMRVYFGDTAPNTPYFGEINPYDIEK